MITLVRMRSLLLTLTIILMAGAAAAIEPASAPAVGLVNLSAANFRRNPAHSAELVTQASFGTPVAVIEDRGNWLLTELPDGYRAWVDRPAISLMSPDMMNRWRNSSRLIVTSMSEIHALTDTLAGQVPDNVVSDLVLGSIVEGVMPDAGTRFAAVSFPDGRCGYVDSWAVRPFKTWSEGIYNPQAILSVAYSLMGVPYLWGGTTTKGVDCSGLVKVAFFASGLILPRDAAKQATCGIAVDHSTPHLFQPADLLFFSPEDDRKSTRITHVGIYDNDSLYVHASGSVRVNGFNPSGARYIDRPVKRAVRIALPGRELPGTIRVAEHPWYFNR